jgi:molybdopterin-guanine dinucleotide biosynthesis protein A
MLLTTNNNQFVGVILAGGPSKRMGKDKATLIRNEQSMIDFTAEQLLKAGASDVIVSAEQSYTNRYLTVSDAMPNQGPLGGIHSIITKTLSANPSKNYLFVPVDLPLLNYLSLAKLAHTGMRTAHHAVVSQQTLPLFLHVDTNAKLLLDTAITEEKVKPLSCFVESIAPNYVAVEDELDWLNADTPELWQKAKRHLHSS